ncbi:diguanylate cyclase domain-containing protein [Marinobacter sp. NSM]|uniref:diguanylate cyclase domain-containing protein n=1 Tax=Marinobacter sp. NSM TaxID=3458004 RepID=UPI0040359257
MTDDHGQTTHYAGLFTDINQNRKNEEQIRQLAYYDALTGVPNRRLLEDRLEHAIRHAHRKDMLLAVMFIDLDRFKEVNDTLARLGGDEFIVLLPELEKLSDVIQVAERLIELNRKPYRINDHCLRIGSSIGISLYPKDGTTVQELLNGADIAMYRSKRDGRNQYHLFNPDVAQTA